MRSLFLTLLCLCTLPMRAQEPAASPLAAEAAPVSAEATPVATASQAAPTPTAKEKAIVESKVDGKVDGFLFFATNDAVPEATEEMQEYVKTLDPKTLPDLRQRLAKSFQLKNFQLLGSHAQDVLNDYDSWVVPSKELCLKIDSRGPVPGNGLKLHIQLWQEKKVLVKCDATLKVTTPVFIGGPDWRGGRLIFVVVKK
jgi:hypothetical protein